MCVYVCISVRLYVSIFVCKLFMSFTSGWGRAGFICLFACLFVRFFVRVFSSFVRSFLLCLFVCLFVCLLACLAGYSPNRACLEGFQRRWFSRGVYEMEPRMATLLGSKKVVHSELKCPKVLHMYNFTICLRCLAAFRIVICSIKRF